jgi:replicative DNA helicase
VPREVFSLSNAQVALFLRHLWATDGSVSIPRKSAPRIYYATTSRQLADDVQTLLSRLNIRTRLRTVRPKRGRVGYTVDVSGSVDQLRFVADIGVHGARGRIAAELRVRLETIAPNPNVDTVPKEIWNHVRAKSMPNAGVTARELAARIAMRYCGSALYKSGVSRARMRRLADALGDPYLDQLAESDVFWDEVVSVTSFGEQPVFDATVDATHNFVANGTIVHNSIEQDSDVVMFLYRDEIYNPESDQRGTAEVIVSKHRNGPTGTTRLAFLDHLTKFANMARD